ncbi:FmdB family zinc ribbon protein [Pseudomonadota bacterium]
MPIYEYKASGDQKCEYCADGFELLRKISEPKLEQCPRCGAAVERQISAPNLGGSGPSLDTNNIEKHGFTQYKKSGKGVYEKTAGKGPDVITGD